MTGDLLRVPAAARRLRVSTSYAYKLAKEGAIPVIRFGTAVRVPAEALEEHIRRQIRIPGEQRTEDLHCTLSPAARINR